MLWSIEHNSGDITSISTAYNNTLTEILDKHAPKKEKTVSFRMQVPWFNDTLHQVKRERRKVERKWRRSRLASDYHTFKEVKNRYNLQLFKYQCTFYCDKITECGTDSKALFQIMNSILHGKTSPKLPEHENGEELANRFANFFQNKILTIRENFQSGQSAVTDDNPVVCSSTWVEFHKVDQRELSRLVSKSPSKSCILDPIPTWMVKILTDSLIPAFSNIINKSLSTGEVPIGLKTVQLAISHLSRNCWNVW